MTVLYRVG